MLIFSVSSYAQEEEKPKKPTVQVGGALRFNYNLSSWKKDQIKRGGDFGFDVFRINVKAAHKNLKLNADYRFYSAGFGGGMLKQGWVAYEFKNKKDEIQVGLTQVPFGITQYNSHSWFFSINYYLGLEDDHDMGVKYMHRGKQWDFDLAFFKNAEELRFGNNSDVSDSRYSYDVGSISSINGKIFRNKEVNQLNGRVLYKIGKYQKIGLSAQYGGLYNLDTKKTGTQYAFAGHYELSAGRVKIKAQTTHYNNNPENPSGHATNVIAMTAYGAPYLVASSGLVSTFGIAYSLPVKWGIISSLQFYNDFGYLNKTDKSFENSMMNVAGVLVTAGNVYTYIDFASGKNQPWLGSVWTQALAHGTPNEKWETRFNINLGYYF